MLGNDTYKEFARWREHWMSIMSPKSVRFELSAFKTDEKTPVALKEAHFQKQERALTQTGSSQKPGEPETTVTNKACFVDEAEYETSIWED